MVLTNFLILLQMTDHPTDKRSWAFNGDEAANDKYNSLVASVTSGQYKSMIMYKILTDMDTYAHDVIVCKHAKEKKLVLREINQ